MTGTGQGQVSNLKSTCHWITIDGHIAKAYNIKQNVKHTAAAYTRIPPVSHQHLMQARKKTKILKNLLNSTSRNPQTHSQVGEHRISTALAIM